MLSLAILSSMSGLLLGAAVGYILGYKNGTKRTVEYFEKKLVDRYKNSV